MSSEFRTVYNGSKTHRTSMIRLSDVKPKGFLSLGVDGSWSKNGANCMITILLRAARGLALGHEIPRR